MPKTIIEYNCMMISPSDVDEERKSLTDVVSNWNAQIGQALGAKVDLVRWESHSVPEIGGEAQSILNKQLVDDCDFGIAVFWSRLGTPTDNYDSGSVEELRKLMERGARVLIYFSREAIPQELLNTEQYDKLQKFKKEIKKEGLLGEYNGISNLKEQVQLHLTSVIADLISKDKPEISQLTKSSNILPKPDIRIKASPSFVSSSGHGMKAVLSIEVQNHSPMTLFMGMVSIQLKSKEQLFFPHDSVTGEFQRRRELRPGEAFSIRLYPEYIFDQIRPDELSHAVVKDDIDRIYESDHDKFRSVISDIWNEFNKEKA